MTLVDWIRTGIALHPEFIQEAESLIRGGGVALEQVLVNEAATIVPLGSLLKPLLAKAAAEGDGALQKRIDHFLDGFVQAQPDVVAGDGRGGLISLEELPAGPAKN